MRKRALLLLLLAAACSSPRPRPPRGEPVLTVEGKVEHGPFRFGAGDLAALPRLAFPAAAPGVPGEARFEGVALAKLLTESMEPKKDADLAVVHGIRGLAVPVPLSAVRQLRPVLADTANGGALASWKASAAPLVLAWPNVQQPGIDTDPRMRSWWVEGITRIELANWNGTYGKALRVPPGSSDEARLGADPLAALCISCHRVRGAGGTRGPALEARRLPVGDEAFAAAMRDHLRQQTGNAAAPETSAATARQIAAFLRAASVAGTPRVEDEPPPPDTRMELPPDRRRR